MEYPRQPFLPAPRRGTPSTKRMTCNFWARGDCRYSEEECMYAHAWTDLVEGQQVLRRPSLPGRNVGHGAFAAESHGSFHRHSPASLAAPLPVSVGTTPASTHITASVNTNASTSATNLAFTYTSTNPTAYRPAQRPSQHHTSMLPQGQGFNPAAAAFEPTGAADLRHERARADALLKLVQQQTAVITSIYGDQDNVAASLRFAAKDINDVATAMKDGPVGAAANNVKKLTYRAADIEGVVRKQGEWKRTLQKSMLETEAGLKEIGGA